MDVKYSRYDLVGKELASLEESQGFLTSLFDYLLYGRYLGFEISVPNDLYFRADILCEDIIQKSDSNFTQADLAEHVFLSFMDNVIDNDSNVGSIYNKLNVRKQQLPLINEQPLLPTKSATTVKTKIHRDDVLRAEVLLKDLSYFAPGHKFDVEELIEIVYLDFLLEYVRGRRQNVIKEILEYLV